MNPPDGSRGIVHIQPTRQAVWSKNPTDGSRWIIQILPKARSPLNLLSRLPGPLRVLLCCAAGGNKREDMHAGLNEDIIERRLIDWI